MNDWKEKDFWERIEEGKTVGFYLYTPLCGTCQVASKMLSVVEVMLPNLTLGKADLNFMPNLAEQFQIESVPCLLIFNTGKLEKKIYAFHSVPYLYETLKEL